MKAIKTYVCMAIAACLAASCGPRLSEEEKDFITETCSNDIIADEFYNGINNYFIEYISPKLDAEAFNIEREEEQMSNGLLGGLFDLGNALNHLGGQKNKFEQRRERLEILCRYMVDDTNAETDAIKQCIHKYGIDKARTVIDSMCIMTVTNIEYVRAVKMPTGKGDFVFRVRGNSKCNAKFILSCIENDDYLPLIKELTNPDNTIWPEECCFLRFHLYKAHLESIEQPELTYLVSKYELDKEKNKANTNPNDKEQIWYAGFDTEIAYKCILNKLENGKVMLRYKPVKYYKSLVGRGLDKQR